MSKFEPVEPRPDFVAMEKRLLKWWYESGIVDKYLHKNDSSKKRFSFLDGPITANNPMGVHHAWGRTYKDLWQRYYNMQGFRQRFQNGFDCQGLWVEVEVEKELGLKSKRDIENLVPGDPKASIAKFVNLCKERVYKYAAMQTEQSKRLGYFMDWDNSYYTLSDDNNYMIWHFLKKCHERGLIYKGRDSVPWCPRCGTAISQHEMLGENYKEVTHDSAYIEYPVVGQEDTYLLVWTTTPWTLPANVAVAADPKKEYALVLAAAKGNKYYVLKGRAGSLGLKVVKTLKGEELVGLEYKGPFDHLPRVQSAMDGKPHRVVSADPLILSVSEEEGTGLVHIAPGAGSEDFQLGKKLGLAVIEVIDESANYLDGMEEFSGQNAKDRPELILDFVKQKDGGRYFFDTLTYKHRYPVCWRCQTELVWRVVDEWYIAMDPLRDPMKKVAKKIKWIPEFGLKRELDWLENMQDWLISKKRYWGLALPIWECAGCGNFEVLGGFAELGEKAAKGWEEFDGHSPHRPWIDEIKIKCSKCGQLTSRISDVGNPWLDAGIVPFSTISADNRGESLYKVDKDDWGKWFPADFITESFPGQFKNWFYSLVAMSTVLEAREPFKTVLGFATLFGEDGRPMHKSWGNMVEFEEGADKIGVDVMRWIYAIQNPEQNLNFGYGLAEGVRRRFYLILWNSYKFFVDYAKLAGWRARPPSKLKVLDQWVLSRLNSLALLVGQSLKNYDAASASAALESFVVGDLSTWYIRRSRSRVGAGAAAVDQEVFLSVCHQVLTTLCRLLAPFMPFVAEEIYKNLTEEESVHLADYPQPDTKMVNRRLEKAMEIVRNVASAGNAVRKEKAVPTRQPLSLASVVHSVEQPDGELVQLIKEELNVKRVSWKMDKTAKVPQVELDLALTPELEEEGKTRELARRIQEERKKAGVALDQQVSVTSPWVPSRPELVDWLKERTLAAKLTAAAEFTVTPL